MCVPHNGVASELIAAACCCLLDIAAGIVIVAIVKVYLMVRMTIMRVTKKLSRKATISAMSKPREDRTSFISVASSSSSFIVIISNAGTIIGKDLCKIRAHGKNDNDTTCQS